MKTLQVAFVPQSGNYVAVDVQCLTDLQDVINPSTSISDDLHITLMYSPDSTVDTDDVATVLPLNSFIPLEPVSSIGFEIFGKEEDDERAVVALIKSEALVNANRKLQDLGMEYTFPDYRPHVTLCYVPVDEAESIVEQLSGQTLSFKLGLIKSDAIDKDYAK